MKYQIELLKKARKFIKAQPPKQQERKLKAIYKIPDGDIKPLSGQKNAYRLRVGDFRIIYEIDDSVLLITVVNVGNRGQIYNRL